MPRPWHALPYWTPAAALQGTDCYDPALADEETEAAGGELTCPRGQRAASLESGPGSCKPSPACPRPALRWLCPCLLRELGDSACGEATWTAPPSPQCGASATDRRRQVSTLRLPHLPFPASDLPAPQCGKGRRGQGLKCGRGQTDLWPGLPCRRPAVPSVSPRRSRCHTAAWVVYHRV